MDQPLPPTKMQRIATQLAGLSLELVEQIISNLTLQKALDILWVPRGSTPSTEQQFMVEAFLISPTWKHVFASKALLDQFLLVWEAMNRISWICTQQPIGTVMDENWFLHDIKQGADQLGPGPQVLEKLKKAFFSIIPGITESCERRYRPNKVVFRNDQLKAIFQLLPPEYDTLLDASEAYGSENNLQASYHEIPIQLLINAAFGMSPHSETMRMSGWDEKGILRFADHMGTAWETLQTARVHELETLASLYDRNPNLLKPALAPQLCYQPKNTKHIPQRVRAIVYKMRQRRVGGLAEWKFLELGECRSYFKFPHNFLVPYNWCLRLFTIVTDEKKVDIPPELVEDLNRATQGLKYVQEYGGGNKQPYPRVKGDNPRNLEFIIHIDPHKCRPTPIAELNWLTSFLAVVSWMEAQYPDLAQELRRPVGRLHRFGKGRGRKRVILEQSDYDIFIATSPAREVAAYLEKDSSLSTGPINILNNSLPKPSLLAFSMPDFESSKRAQEIANYLTTQQELPIGVQRFMYENVIEKIKRYFQKRPEQQTNLSDKEGLAHEVLDGSKQITNPDHEPTNWDKVVQDYANAVPKKPLSPSKSCYICRHTMNTQTESPHPIFSAMCKPCGGFNLAGSNMSLPENLDLAGKTAFVTGGRVNLGFYTALRLLRCGAKVIVSSRYPRDSFVRYQQQPDSADWLDDRLRIVGADFRTARDAFELVNQVKSILSSWSTDPKLDILINNAAQTLTDSESKEKDAVNREGTLHVTLPLRPALPETASYLPRVGGGIPTALLESEQRESLLSASSSSTVQLAPEKSSWVQGISEIPYADVMTAQAVNAFVPLILIRELLPLLSRCHKKNEQPGQIINVSSREGIFETTSDSSSKQGRHVHTNMSKAALNMITETEAATAWKTHRVAMNTVDPGYMSAAPEMEKSFDGVRPLGWEDGAGRVLWPVAMAIGEEQRVIWGRFLKHYGAVGASSSLG